MTFGPATALVTGASSGFGALIAEEFARRGARVLVVARRADRLQELADRLSAEHDATVDVLASDLADGGVGPQLLARATETAGPIECVVNNAGFGIHGPVAENDPEMLRQMLDLNVTALTSITRAFLDPMLAAGRGTIVNVASIGGFQPGPNMAAYLASKAYVLHFTEALWGELKGTGVRTTALCPGFTDTEFLDVSGARGKGHMISPAQVVQKLFGALDRSTLPPYLVPDLPNRIQSIAGRIAPRRFTIAMADRMLRD